jgi:hypothetical protein
MDSRATIVCKLTPWDSLSVSRKSSFRSCRIVRRMRMRLSEKETTNDNAVTRQVAGPRRDRQALHIVDDFLTRGGTHKKNPAVNLAQNVPSPPRMEVQMIRHNHAAFWRNIAFGVLLASTITLLACGASRNMPGGTMPDGTTPGGTIPGGGMGQHPMSHPRPH